MNELPPDEPNAVSIEQLLLRDDTWLGHSRRFAQRKAVSTGFDDLDSGLLNRGWPLGSLVEVCQDRMQAEWHLLGPALREITGLIMLVNPPEQPFCKGLIQAEIDLDRLIIVKTADKNHFVASFIELSRASVGAILAWQPKETLTYTELRKCALAAAEGASLCFMIRPPDAQRLNSPAALRLLAQLIPAGVEVTVFKQKGFLQKSQPQPIVLATPGSWRPALPYYALNKATTTTAERRPPRLASVTPLRGKP